MMQPVWFAGPTVIINFLASAPECKHHAMKAETGVEVEPHTFLTSALEEDVWSAPEALPA
jgi:hypothetical protein